MQNYAIVDTNTKVVVNTVVWDGISAWNPGPSFTAIQSDVAQIGWIWDGTSFSKPIPPSPEV